jgi:hypothetical protein
LEYPPFHSNQDWYRLIPSRFPPVDVYARLAPALREAAPEIEALTNPRLKAKERLAGGPAAVDGTSPRLQNWNHAPFAYRNPEGSYLLNAVHGAMEIAGTVEAALAIAIRHREIFLSRTAERPMDLDMRLLVTPVRGEFADLRTSLALDAAEAVRWAIGQELFDTGALGAVFRRPERPEDAFLAVFDPTPLGRSVQSTHYRFVWDGAVIRSAYDFADAKEIRRSELLAHDTGREAA